MTLWPDDLEAFCRPIQSPGCLSIIECCLACCHICSFACDLDWLLVKSPGVTLGIVTLCTAILTIKPYLKFKRQ